jgi:hypothetical protein
MAALGGRVQQGFKGSAHPGGTRTGSVALATVNGGERTA